MNSRTILSVYPLSLLLLSACGSLEPNPSFEGSEPVDSSELSLNGVDLTPTSTANVSDLRGSQIAAEGIDKVHDNNIFTKLYVTERSNWIQYRLTAPAVITSYNITSGNDHAQRDPKNWTFEGSVDGLTWQILDSRSDQSFAGYNQTNEYTFSNSTLYHYYRLNISDNLGDNNDLQLSEFRIGGTAASGTLPGSATMGTATVNSNSVSLTWSAAPNAAGYWLQRVREDGAGTVEFWTTATSHTDANLAPGTTYIYQVQAANSSGVRGFPSTTRARATTAGVATSGLKDITALSSFAPTDQFATTGFEGVERLTDNEPSSKYLRYGATTTWIQLRAPADSVVTQYTLTSANDYPTRDPKNWTLQGSADGVTWTTLDTRTNQGFARRFQKRTFTCNPRGLAFAFYRLSVLQNNGASDTQIAEWRLLGTTATALGAPVAPSALAAAALSGNQVRLTWTDNAIQRNPETSFRVDRATDSGFTQNLVTRSAGANSNEFRATALDPSRTYYFRVSAVNAAGSSSVVGPVNATTPSNTPPTSFAENNWYGKEVNGVHYGHNRTLYRTYLDSHVAIYFDEFVPNRNSITWFNPVMSEAWAYTKNTYGSFGDPILYVVANQDAVPSDTHDVYNVAGLVNMFSPDGYYKNLEFSVSTSWSQPDFYNWLVPSLTHEMAHIVEFNNNDVYGSPSFDVWGDSKWAEIFQYDLYRNLTTVPSDLANHTYQAQLQSRDVYGRYWFKDWYYPLYNGNFGNTATDKKGAPFLVRYLQLLAQHLPKRNSTYARNINLGEFIHFCAGAAGVDLQDEAKVAFRWTPEVELQLAEAQAEFPAVTALYRGNTAPGFTFDPIARFATANAALNAQTLVGTAADPNLNNTLTYSKISGASWLTVASNGALTGTPPSTGTSTAVVRVTDQGGLFDETTLSFTVLGAQASLLSDGLESSFNLWTDGGTTDWDRATDQRRSGTYAARCGESDNSLTSDNLNTTGKQLITVSFWYRDSGIDDDDEVYLQLYNGASYLNRFELGNSTEGTWNQYSVTLYSSVDPAFFRSDFRVRFAGSSIDTGEWLWIDDVQVTAQ